MKDINQLRDLTCPDDHPQDECLDFTAVSTQLGAVTAEIEEIVDSVTNVIDAATGLYDTAMRAVALAVDMKNNLRGDLETMFTNASGLAAANFDASLDLLEALPGAIEGAIESGLQDMLDEVLLLKDDALRVLSGQGIGQQLGDLALDAFENQVIGPILDIVNESLGGCYARERREACTETCDDNGGVFLWFPVDFLKDPNAAGAAGLFLLDQVGFLDEIAQLNMNGDSPFLDAVNGAIGALSDITAFLANLQDIIASFLTYVDRFTEGYHLGAYDSLRPDLHMCVGYAGHGAYAQMGNLGNGNVSLGARYTSHNLSKRHRAQFRSGGFAVNAWGRGLSLAPTIELNIQMDGWKHWDAQRPFGIPAGGIPVGTIEKFDVFHLLDENDLDPFVSGGEVTWGSLLIRDLYDVRYGDANNPDIWPRLTAREEVPWEFGSVAVLSAGLNLNLEIERQQWDLPTIQIIPGILSATPYFALGAGIEWTHDANHQLIRIRDKINEGLSASDQLTDADFERDMHAFQAPDLSADNGTSAYVEPEIGVEAFLGFRIWKIKIGAGASVGLSINIEPAGYGGVVDLNAALSKLLTSVNPPSDAPVSLCLTPARRRAATIHHST